MISEETTEAIAVTDCGSTTTKAILITRGEDGWRLAGRAESPTTVEAPVEDVTLGIFSALGELSKCSGMSLVGPDGRLQVPYISTSSAGGGLQMAVAGLVRNISAKSAERAALGAGAIVAGVVARDEDEELFEQVERLRKLRPDMVLMAGGTDGGAMGNVLEVAELLAAAKPTARLGEQYRLPVIFAGNKDAAESIGDALEGLDVHVVDNVRPVIERESLAQARLKVHELFLEHVMGQAPGFSKLVSLADADIMPTPSAVGLILEMLERESGEGVLCVDIGGATTDVFSVVGGHFARTVSANLGMSYSAAHVLKEAGLENISRWVPAIVTNNEIRDAILNKTVRPSTIPDSPLELEIEQALAREALRLSLLHHKASSRDLRGTVKEDLDFSLGSKKQAEGLAMEDVGLIIGSGGVLSHAPSAAQTVAMLVDAFEPMGVTRVAKDSIFMLPHLGLLSKLMPEAAREVLHRDCLRELALVLSPAGRCKEGKSCLAYSIEGDLGTKRTGHLQWGEWEQVLAQTGENLTIDIKPARGVDLGAGPGRSLSMTQQVGPVGLVIDARGGARHRSGPLVLENRGEARFE